MHAARRKTFFQIGGWIAAVAVVVLVSKNLGAGLRELARQPAPRDPGWGLVVASGVAFLCAHAVLVQTWRSILATFDAQLGFWTAARIWSVSNLGKYVPGKIWQILAMSAMSRDAGISQVAAPAAAILSTLLNVFTGFIVAVTAGRPMLEQLHPGWGALASTIVVIAGMLLLITPFALPQLTPAIARLTGRSIETTISARAVVYGIVGNVVAWIIYGIAFELLVVALVGHAAGSSLTYIAAYTVSYLSGYLAFFAPAGAGVREAIMLSALPAAGLASRPEAALITIVSRVWLTILEIAPALFFWFHHRTLHRSVTSNPSDVPI